MRAKISIVVLLVAGLAGILWWSMPVYLRNAFIHWYANIDDYKIFPNKAITVDREQPWPKAVNYNRRPIPPAFLRWIEYYQTNAFVVVKNGELVHESYYHGFTAQSISNSFSMAKSIVSILTGCAIKDGFIDSLNVPVGHYFQPFNQPAYQSLRIIHLLTMSSGLNWDESYSSPFSVTTQAYYGDNIRPLMASLTVVDTPGKRFRYLSCNTQILSYVLEAATGKDIADYAREKLWIPLGASRTALWSTDREGGDEKAYCCFFATATDFARLGQLVLNGGKWNGRQLVDSAYLAQAIKPAAWLLSESGDRPLTWYGHHFWLLRYKNNDVALMQGLAGQYILIIPSQQKIVVRLGEKRCYYKINSIPCDVYIWLALADILAN